MRRQGAQQLLELLVAFDVSDALIFEAETVFDAAAPAVARTPGNPPAAIAPEPVDSGRVGDVLDEHLAMPRDLAAQLQCRVDRDTVEPRRELRLMPEALELEVRLDEDLLAGVFAALVIAEDAEDDLEEARMVTRHENLERDVVAAENPLHQDLVVVSSEGRFQNTVIMVLRRPRSQLR